MNNKSSLIQTMASHRSGGKPLPVLNVDQGQGQETFMQTVMIMDAADKQLICLLRWNIVWVRSKRSNHQKVIVGSGRALAEIRWQATTRIKFWPRQKNTFIQTLTVSHTSNPIVIVIGCFIDLNIAWVFFKKRVHKQSVNFGSGNGLTPIRWLAITCIKFWARRTLIMVYTGNEKFTCLFECNRVCAW